MGHGHQVVAHPAPGQLRYLDCHETLTLRRPGSAARIRLVFRNAPDRIVPDGAYVHSGAVGTTAGARLNLHEPGTARALLDEALRRGARLDAGHDTTELDGWPLFDAVVSHAGAVTGAAGAPSHRN